MYKICIITVYFGRLPNYFNLWLESCKINTQIDFLFITDQEVENVSTNVKVIRSSLPQIKLRFEEHMQCRVALDHPYKLCDYKPLYGEVFQDLIEGYDFWGHCDIDLIWGNLRSYLTEPILKKYDKIFPLGHLSLYRNIPRVNQAFRLNGSQMGSFRDVISTNKSCIFDERLGINKIFEINKFPLYDRETAADIGFRNQRMIIAGSQIKNYSYQLFTYEFGHCYRYYIDNNNVNRDEFSYIHLQKRPYFETVKADKFIIAQSEFIPFNREITQDIIKKYNPYKGILYEWIEYHYRDLSFRIRQRLKQLFIK